MSEENNDTCTFDGDKSYEPLFRIIPKTNYMTQLLIPGQYKMKWNNPCTPTNEKESLRISILKWRSAYFFITEGSYVNVDFGASETCACCTYANAEGDKEGRTWVNDNCNLCPIGKDQEAVEMGCEGTPWSHVKSEEPETVKAELEYLEDLYLRLYDERFP